VTRRMQYLVHNWMWQNTDVDRNRCTVNPSVCAQMTQPHIRSAVHDRMSTVLMSDNENWTESESSRI